MPTAITQRRRAVFSHVVESFGCLALIVAGTFSISAASAADGVGTTSAKRTTAQRSQPVVDRAVVPAGGVAACQECGPAGCRHGHAHRHHRDCRDGACVPYCPVRPGTFGFYGTQWRRWPGEGVVPVSHERDATPASPPRSEVPNADEESLEPAPAELPEPDAEAPATPADEPAALPAAPEPEAEAATPRQPDGGGETVAPEPQEPPAATEKPADTDQPAKTRPEDENLFDDSAARRVRRKIPVASASTPGRGASAAAAVTPATHEGVEPVKRSMQPRPAPRAVPLVPFDPRAELERMRRQPR